jgi:drug/metabolite transporter (DMT)-like permease
MGITLALMCMLCFASNIVLSRYAVARMPIDIGFLIVLTVNIAVALLVFAVELGLRSTPFEWQSAPAACYALSGVLGSYLGRQMMYDTVRLLGPARASVFHSSAPVVALFGAWLLLGETLDASEMTVMCLVLFGLWFTQAPAQGGQAGDRPSAEFLRRGMLIGLLTLCGFGMSNALRGLAMRGWDEPVFGTLIACLAAMLLQLVTTPSIAGAWRQIRASERRGILLYAVSGVISVGGAMFLTASMAHMKVALAALISHTTPLLIFPLSVFVFGNREGLSLRTTMGAVMVLAGISFLALH